MDIFLLISFLAPLSVYTLTLEPTVYWLDSGIYLSAIKCFGIAYPPGFPLYMILAKLWSYLPLKDYAWRVNFLSAIFGALACGFIYLSAKRMLKNLGVFCHCEEAEGRRSNLQGEILIRVISLSAAMSFGFAYTHWSQAINAEVYSFHALFVSIILYLFIRFDTTVSELLQKRLILLLALTYGLSFANHPMTVGLLPAFGYFCWINRPILLKFKRPFLLRAGAIFLFSGLLPYLYLPIRSRQNPPIDWGNPENLVNFVNHITGRQWTGEKANFAFFNAEFIQNIAKAGELSLAQFKLFGIALSILGFFYLFNKNRRLCLLFFLIYIVSMFFGIVYKTGEFESWFIPAYLIMSLWIGAGLLAAALYLIKRFNKAAATGLVIAACGFLVIPILIGNYPKLDRSKNYYPQDYANNLLKNLPANSILILEGDNPLSTVAFMQIAQGQRQDVFMFHYKGALHNNWYRENLRYLLKDGVYLPIWRCPSETDLAMVQNCHAEFLAEFVKANLNKFPIFEILPEPVRGYRLIPAGMLYKISQDPREEPNLSYWNFSFHDESFEQPKDIQAKYNSSWLEMLNGYISAYKNLADFYLWNKKSYADAAVYYVKTLKLLESYSRFDRFDPVFLSNIFASLGVSYLEQGDFDLALKNLDAALSNYTFNPLAYAYKGLLYERLGKKDEAREFYRQALKIEPGNELAKKRLERVGFSQLKEK